MGRGGAKRPLGDLAAALELLPVPVFTLGRDATITWINHAAREFLGDVVGKPITHVVAPESLPAARDAIAKKIVGDVESTEYEAVLLRSDGSRVTVEINSVALADQGHIVGVFGLFRPEREMPEPEQPSLPLTQRQLQVLRLLAAGYSTEQMSDQLKLSPETVRNHVRELLRRLGVHSRLGAVVAGRERGLI
jgi:PAS domain S-box-containing protein